MDIINIVVEKIRDYDYCWQVRWLVYYDDGSVSDGRYGWLKSEQKEMPDEKEIDRAIALDNERRVITSDIVSNLQEEKIFLEMQKTEIEFKIASIAVAIEAAEISKSIK